MLTHLKSKGFKVERITPDNITQLGTVETPIVGEHVLLLLCKLIKGQASWMVTHGGMLFHNFEITGITQYEFINHPILEAYVVWHPSYKEKKS